MIDEKGWFAQAKQVVSPFYNERPERQSPKLLVIHNISLPPEKYGGPYIEQLFTGQLNPADHPYFAEIHHLHVSAHCLIRRDGELIQFVSFDDRAWHAGKSRFFHRENCNDFSIGIELEGSDFESFTKAQYQRLTELSRELMARYDLDYVAGHSDIAPIRKTDPGPFFDWPRYLADLPASIHHYTPTLKVSDIDYFIADYSNPAHAAAIVSLLNRYAQNPMGGGQVLSDFTQQNLIDALQKLPNAFSVLAFKDQAPVGLVNCFFGFSTFACQPLVNIHDVFVDDAYRGQHVCHHMFSVVEQVARFSGAYKLTLEVLNGNHAAKQAYQKCGFSGYELDAKTGQALFWEKKLT